MIKSTALKVPRLVSNWLNVKDDVVVVTFWVEFCVTVPEIACSTPRSAKPIIADLIRVFMLSGLCV